MSAGPSMRAPGPRRAPSYTGVSTKPSPKCAARVPRRACAESVIVPSSARWSGLCVVRPADPAHAPHHRLLRPEAEAPLRLVLVVETFGEIEETGLVESYALGNRDA